MARATRLIRLLWDASGERPQNAWMVRLAVAIALTPMILLFPFTLLFFVQPLWMFKSSEMFGIFALFYAAPWAAAALLCYVAATRGEATMPGGD